MLPSASPAAGRSKRNASARYEAIMLATLIADFLVACRAAGLAPKTVDWYADLLRPWSAFVSDRDYRDPRVTREFIVSLQARSDRYVHHPRRRRCAGPLSVFTIRAYVRAIRRFFNWLSQEGQLADNPGRRVAMPRKPKRLPKAMDARDFYKLLGAAAGTRDRALLLVLRDTGCRASEICDLKLGELDLERGLATVIGKGNKERYVFLVPETCAAIRRWLDERGRVGKTAPVFETDHGPLRPSTLYNMLRRTARRAGVSGRFNPHSLRHAFGRDWVLNGGDLGSLADLLGHADIETTKIYSQFSIGELQSLHRQHGPLQRPD